MHVHRPARTAHQPAPHLEAKPRPAATAQPPRQAPVDRPAAPAQVRPSAARLEAARARARAAESLARATRPTPLQANLATARRTPTGRAIVAEAERRRVPIYVLPDRAYDQRYPGTAGVTVNGAVFMPARSVANPRDASVLVHELTHAVLGPAINSRGGFPYVREAALGQTFARMGLDPADGRRLAQETASWKDSVAAQHVATSFLTRDVRREQAGLPREDRAVRDGVIAAAAQREHALALIRRRADAQRGGAPYSDRQFLADWMSAPQGRLFPPRGASEAERARWLDGFLTRYLDERFIEPKADA